MIRLQQVRWWMLAYVLVVTAAVLSGVQPVFSQSSNVVIIGGSTVGTNNYLTDANFMGATFGGYLPVSATTDARLGAFTFTPMSLASVNATNLASFDTAVLNIASYEFGCNTSKLSTTQKTDIVAFVQSGHKLIIYDSECYPGPVDYSWLPFPFITANPGAMGASGTLTIVENNTLSSNIVSDPYYINAGYLGSVTDAVGDMNVMQTYDSHWCLDMSGTNYIGKTGPVHTYAKYPSGTDVGLIIYNGLDQDVQPDSQLIRVWIFELQQKFNPSSLPCGFTVIGIGLTPATATNVVGASHTVTAKLTDLLGNPQPNVPVTFTVISGPNANAPGTCDPVSCYSDANGEVKFTYTGSTTPGKDVIEASFTDQQGTVLTATAEKNWTLPPVIDVALDIHPTSCPNPLNAKSKGVTPVAVLGTGTFDVSTINLTSIRLEGVAPARWSFEDVATPFFPLIGKQGPQACNTLGPDGLMDLVLHFETQALFHAFTPPLVDRETRVLKLTGNLKDEFGGTKIAGEDVVVILAK